MNQNQEDIDALLAEVSALASEAVTEVATEPAPAQASATATAAPPRASADKSPVPTGELQRILRLEVPVIVQLAERSMALSAILNFSSGSIIEFDQPADSELDLMINNKCIGQGQAVKVGENFGLRVTHIGSLKDRIQAMGR
jgi:flagellar motor switch protein FliN/FliY